MSLVLKLWCLLFFQNVFCALDRPASYIKIAGIFENIQLHEAAFKYSHTMYNSGKTKKDVRVSDIVDPNIISDEPFTAYKGTCSFLRQSIVGLFGPQASLNLDIVQAITEKKDIPHILTRWVPPALMGFQTINFFPDPEKLAAGFLAIINALEWETFTILYTDAENLIQINEFIRQAKDSGIIVYIENVNALNTGDFRPALRTAARSGQKNFVLDCPISDLKNLLTQLQQVGLLTGEYNYFLSNLDSHTEDLTSFQHSDAVITGVHLILPEDEKTQRAMKDLCVLYNVTFKLDCGKPELDVETALILDAGSIFMETLNSLGIKEGIYLDCDNNVDWPEGLNIINTLKAGTFEGITGPIEFNQDGFRSAFQLTIYQIRDKFFIRGSWNTSVGFSEDIQLTFSDEEEEDEENLKYKNLNILISLTEPYAQMINSPNPLRGNDRFEGFAIDLIQEIAELEGFEYTFIVREDHKHGYFDPKTGKWNGMIGDVIEGHWVMRGVPQGSVLCLMLNRNCIPYVGYVTVYKADLAISDLTISRDRVDPVEFTLPFMTVGVSILFRKPYKVLPGFFDFAEPFSVSFWQYLGASYLVVVICLFVIGRISPGQWERLETCKESKKYAVNDLTFLNSLWFVAAGLFRQTTNVKVNSIAAKIIAGAWYIYCFVLFAMYISYTLTRNAVIEKEELFEDVEGLLKYTAENDIKFGALKGGSTEAFFKNSKNPTYQQVASYMEENPEEMVETTIDGIIKAEEGSYAFFMESATIDYTIRRHCALTSYGGLLDSKGFGIAVKKGSPLLGNLNRALIKLQSSGELLRLQKKWWEEKLGGEQCDDQENTDMNPKTVVHINGLTYFAFVGLAIALVCATFEFTLYIIKLSKKVKTSFSSTFGQEIRKCFGKRHTVQSVDAIVLTRPENGNDSSKDNV